jgi:hypothetical protein
MRLNHHWQRAVCALCAFVCLLASPQPTNAQSTHDDLVELHRLWREFQAPELIDGVPDYSQSAMRDQARQLPMWQARLALIDTVGWSIPDQVDWHLVWAEMNGLEFEHSVRQSWSSDPAFYVWFFPDMTDVPAREGPNIHGAIELPNYSQPLSDVDAREITQRLGVASNLYAEARINLTGDARDLWVLGTRSIREQTEALESFAKSEEARHPDLAQAARSASAASRDFAEWLESKVDQKKGSSGVGKENYTWNLRNVHLVPYSWDEEILLLKRELHRSHSALRLEEQRNRALPMLKNIDNAADYDRLVNEAITEYIEFLDREEILTMKPYMEPALRARAGRFTESEGLRGFFSEITYQDPIVMRTHDYHWIELARLREEPYKNPIRQTPLLYNIFDSRAEGMATAMEELMMRAGFLDDRPRSRELVWILLAQRAARGLAGMYQHGLEMTFDESTRFASKWTPRGLLPADGGTIQHEEHFYLRQPAYGESYVIGKLMIDELIAEYSRQRNGDFVWKDFMDEYNRVGVIPVSLIYWEMTGDRSMLDAAIGKSTN